MLLKRVYEKFQLTKLTLFDGVILATFIATMVGALTVSASDETPKAMIAPIAHDVNNKLIVMTAGNKSLVLRLNYNRKCMIDKVIAKDKEVTLSKGVYSGIKVSDTWHTTHSGINTPNVTVTGNTVVITNISFGGGGINVTEKWDFTVKADTIVWRINRTYLSAGMLQDSYLPGWDFANLSTWTGALLGNGGVAWCKLLDLPHIHDPVFQGPKPTKKERTPASAYGAHTSKVTFWNKDDNTCLRILPKSPSKNNIAVKFSRQPSDIFTLSYYVTEDELTTKFGLRRYLPDRQDVWAPFKVSATDISVEYTLYGLDYDQEYDRGKITYFNGDSIRELLNTIARVGIIDTDLMGANTWCHYGFICLEEPWLAQMGLAIDDQDYFDAFEKTLDNYRDNAVQLDGRVKARWSYNDGFHEAEWTWSGVTYLLDSNPGFVTNVADQYDFNGDLEWVRTHKSKCEKALDYMLNRDSDGDCLVEMMTDSHTQQRSSDVWDVIWASYENAFVNAEMYYALTLWADIEEQLGDDTHAAKYRNFAEALKTSFNKTTVDGGFWESSNQWYVYWRDKDDSIHGNNLGTFVNFAAIAYGICDDTTRRHMILSQIEEHMQKENLFLWPCNIFPYQLDEGHPMNFPFPRYCNGIIWIPQGGELAIKAYAEYDPAIAIKYVKNLLEKYRIDGLAFERYSRKTQKGTGVDTLAGNCLPLVGLYRDIYGVQPKYNRLYLDPHLTADLNGTQLKYWLRDQLYIIDLNYASYAIAINNFKLHEKNAFAITSTDNNLEYFNGKKRTPSMSITKSVDDFFEIHIDAWTTSGGYKRWTESCSNAGATVEHLVADLEPERTYALYKNGTLFYPMRSDSSGCIKFNYTGGYAVKQMFEVKQWLDSPGAVGRRQLFLDDYGIDKIENLTRRMHKPLKKGAVIEPDLPWEMTLQTRCAPAWDPNEEVFKILLIVSAPNNASGTAYAESKDGINFSKPILYQREINGSLENNFVTIDGDASLEWPANAIENMVRDDADPNSHRRYKGLAHCYGREPVVSADCIRWNRLKVPKIQASDESNMSYDRETGTFITTVKQSGPHGRSVWLTTSKDFEHWTKPELIFHADELDQKLAKKNIAERLANPALTKPIHNDPACYSADVYNMGIFRYEGLYIGLPAIYHSTGKDGNNTDGFHLVQLACSRDLHNWQRLGDRQPFIGPSAVASGAYDLTQILPPSSPVLHDDELWFYYTGINYRSAPEGARHKGAICLAVLRRDGFISLDADEKQGSIVTKAFVLRSSKLYVNADVSEGWIRLDVLSDAGEELIKSEPLRGDYPRAKVVWKEGNLQKLKGRTVAIRFTLKNGSLYSYWFDN